MRYSRVLTVLALVGVVALAVTLLSRGGHPARSETRAEIAVKRSAAMATTLQGVLNQEMQRLQRPSLRQTQGVAPAQPGQPCFVNQCSIKPCTQFVQSANGVSTIVSTAPGAQVVAPRLTPPGRPTCIRRANSQSVPALDHPAVPAAPTVSIQTVIGGSSAHRGGVR